MTPCTMGKGSKDLDEQQQGTQQPTGDTPAQTPYSPAQQQSGGAPPQPPAVSDLLTTTSTAAEPGRVTASVAAAQADQVGRKLVLLDRGAIAHKHSNRDVAWDSAASSSVWGSPRSLTRLIRKGGGTAASSACRSTSRRGDLLRPRLLCLPADEMGVHSRDGPLRPGRIALPIYRVLDRGSIPYVCSVLPDAWA